MIRTPSFLCTVSATLASFSLLKMFTLPNRRTASPAFRPASSAGLPDTTLFTLAKGASRRLAWEALVDDDDAVAGCVGFAACAAAVSFIEA